MKWTLLSLATAVLAAAGTPALAGLDFTDRASSSSGGTADFTFNGSTTVGTTVNMVNGFGGPTLATISSTNAANSAVPTLARVSFSYNQLFGNVFLADWTGTPGNPAYNMVVEFGAITLGTVAGNPASLSLNAIEFDEGAGFQTVYNINQALTLANANNKLHINVPVAGGIPLSERDAVRAVRLTFAFNGGSATSVNIRAVVNPEPGTIALFGLGLAGLAGAVRARRKRAAATKSA